MNEEWRAAVGFEGLYEVSNLGRLASLPKKRMITNQWGACYPAWSKRKESAPMPMSHRYARAYLVKGGVRTMQYMHALVLAAFVGPRPPGYDACHYDGDNSNNRLDNLRWDTKRANRQDCIRHNTANRGERHGNSKLTADDVRAIRASQLGYIRCGRLFGVTGSNIRAIRKGRSWSHLQ